MKTIIMPEALAIIMPAALAIIMPAALAIIMPAALAFAHRPVRKLEPRSADKSFLLLFSKKKSLLHVASIKTNAMRQ